MTQLRKKTLEELGRRNYAQTTIHSYLRAVAEFSLHFHRPPNQLGPDHPRALAPSASSGTSPHALCSPKALSAFATLASSLTGDELLSCPSAFNYSAPHHNRR